MHDLFSLIPLLFQATILGKCTIGMCANGQIDHYTNEGLMYKCLVPNRSIDIYAAVSWQHLLSCYYRYCKQLPGDD